MCPIRSRLEVRVFDCCSSAAALGSCRGRIAQQDVPGLHVRDAPKWQEGKRGDLFVRVRLVLGRDAVPWIQQDGEYKVSRDQARKLG